MDLNDWKGKAEAEIVEHLRGSFPTLVAFGDIAMIIAKHSPFKDGVAYMPVPRCATCAHWKRARLGSAGWCGQRRMAIETTPGANLVTMEDFGCVQWKEKG